MEAISKVFTRVLVNDYIKLHPKKTNKNTPAIILEKLKEKVEGKCTKHGYIKVDSVEIYKITPGRVELAGLNGFTQYLVYFYAEICNPLVGSLIKCNVVNSNKFGILAEAGFYSNSRFVNVLEIIIAKNSVNIVSDVDLEKINIGDEIIVEVLGKKFELEKNTLSIVGRVVKDADSSSKKKKKAAAEVQAITDDADADVDVDAEEVLPGADDEEAEASEAEASEAEEEIDEASEAVDSEADEDKSVKGGAFFSDVDEGSVAGDEYDMYGSGADSDGSDCGGDDD
jgi:DNA-directed RNA polymerase subunit E'/Rpb7